MATTEHTAGIMPAVNDIVAGVAIAFAYVVRFGTVAEGQAAGLPLRVTTDLLLPLIGAVWLLVVPTYQVCQKVR
jgi:hypothetical protein